MRPMLPPLLAAALALGAPAARAQETVPPQDDGFDLIEEGAKLLLEGMMREMTPALDEMGRMMQEAEPALRSMLALVDDIRNYEAPERLENGDIIIRRKPGAPPPPALPPAARPPGPQGEIEL
jgi:hypothetical protein